MKKDAHPGPRGRPKKSKVLKERNESESDPGSYKIINIKNNKYRGPISNTIVVAYRPPLKFSIFPKKQTPIGDFI